MFDPKYCPEVVDFVIAHRTVARHQDMVQDNYKIIGKNCGLEITVRAVDEDLFADADCSKVNRDSVVLVYGAMNESFKGVRGAIELSRYVDARFIVVFDSEYADRIPAGEYKDLPFDPASQVSFLEIDNIDTQLVKYFIALFGAEQGERILKGE